MAEFEADEGVVYVGNGATLTGELRAQESVVIDGFVDGKIICRSLTVRIYGAVSGHIEAYEADISGELTGSIIAKQLLTVRSSARVKGNWLCGETVVERGAVLNGIAGDEKLRAESDVMAEGSRSLSGGSTSKLRESAGDFEARIPRPTKRVLGAKLNALGRR